MGGYGSGWHGGEGRPRRRMRVSECRIVLRVEDVYAAIKAQKPPHTAPARLTATVPTNPPATIHAVLMPHPRSRIGRVFFICPSCGHHVGRVYQPAEGYPLACRRCYKLTYRSTQESHKMSAGLMKELWAIMTGR